MARWENGCSRLARCRDCGAAPVLHCRGGDGSDFRWRRNGPSATVGPRLAAGASGSRSLAPVLPQAGGNWFPGVRVRPDSAGLSLGPSIQAGLLGDVAPSSYECEQDATLDRESGRCRSGVGSAVTRGPTSLVGSRLLCGCLRDSKRSVTKSFCWWAARVSIPAPWD